MVATGWPIQAEYEPIAGDARQVEVTSAQLHGRACMVCSSELDGLMDAGHVYTPGGEDGRLGWPVKACPHHSSQGAVA